jgi:molecular chaperone DnaK
VADPIVGIDLGTSNSVVAHADEAGIVRVLADEAGYKIHPSVVSFHPSGGVVVGAAAKQRKVIDPQNTIYSAKRLIGRSFRSPEVQTAKSRMPYQIVEGANQLPLIVTRGGEFAVPEISAIVLDHVRNLAQDTIGRDVTNAVVTVPASFNDAQRSATATAGAIAGITVVRVLNEPTAAALAYGHTRSLQQVIAVYDFGGGTFDITILKLEDQVYEVLGTAGDTFLGGDDLDERIVDRMVAKFLAENRIDLRSNEVSMMRLRAVAEQTKIELSRRSRAVVRIDEIAYGKGGAPLNLQIEVTRDEFVSQVADIFDRTFPVCQEALQLANLGIDRIDDVILVGGVTKIPYVRDQVSRFFAKAPRTDVNPEDAVAVGAALQAMSLERILGKPSRPTSTTEVAEVDDPDEQTKTGLDLERPSTTQVTPAPAPAEDRPKRPTAGYPTRTRPPSGQPASTPTSVPIAALAAQAAVAAATPGKRPTGEMRPTERPVTRGAAVDRFETTTPPPGANALARLTPRPQPAPNASATLPNAVTTTLPGTVPVSAIAANAKTMIGVPNPPSAPAAPPAPVRSEFDEDSFASEEPAFPMSAQLPTMIPNAVPIVPMPATASAPRRTAPSSVPPPPAAPPLPPASPPPRQTQMRAAVAPPPPSPPARPPPAAAPNAPTIALDLAAPSPASTHRGIGPSQGPTYLDLETPAATNRGIAPAPAAPPAPAIMPAMSMAQMPVAPRAAPVVMDVTPRGLGIGTVAGFCEELIRRNSRLPTEMRKVFTTSRDSQNLVRIVVCQGESRRLDNNVVIGDLLLDNLPARPRGDTSIEVTFHLDASGILNVRARDAQTGREQRASLDVIGTVPQQDVAASRDRIAAMTQQRR